MPTRSGTTEKARSATNGSAAKRLVLVSGLFLVVQVAVTDYGPGPEQSSQAFFWFLVGVALLWFLYEKRSRAARAIVIVSAVAGAALYAGKALGDARAAVLCMAFAGQAIPLLMPSVRRHVAGHRS